MADRLGLKWGTLKSWKCESEKAQAALDKYASIGEHSMSAAMQHDTDAQKVALCELIDAVDCDTIYLDWDGKDVTRDEAKRYVMDYGK